MSRNYNKVVEQLEHNRLYRLLAIHVNGRYTKNPANLIGALERWSSKASFDWIDDVKVRTEYRKLMGKWGDLPDAEVTREMIHYAKLHDSVEHGSYKHIIIGGYLADLGRINEIRLTFNCPFIPERGQEQPVEAIDQAVAAIKSPTEGVVIPPEGFTQRPELANQLAELDPMLTDRDNIMQFIQSKDALNGSALMVNSWDLVITRDSEGKPSTTQLVVVRWPMKDIGNDQFEVDGTVYIDVLQKDVSLHVLATIDRVNGTMSLTYESDVDVGQINFSSRITKLNAREKVAVIGGAGTQRVPKALVGNSLALAAVISLIREA